MSHATQMLHIGKTLHTAPCRTGSRFALMDRGGGEDEIAEEENSAKSFLLKSAARELDSAFAGGP